MKSLALVLVGITGLLALSSGAQAQRKDRKQFDSAHTLLLEMTIPEGVIYTRAPRAAKTEITHQLQYTIGQLNHFGSVAELANFQISINGTTALTGKGQGGLTKVSYAAKGILAWNREHATPSSLELVLPGSGSNAGLDSFRTTYGPTCSDIPSDVLPGNFWYHYRPLMEACALRAAATSPTDTSVVRVRAILEPSAMHTEGKSPEYGKLWEDRILRVTFVFGKYKVGGKADDVGVEAYEQAKSSLFAAFGEPKLGLDIDHRAAWIWHLPQGQLHVTMGIVDELASIPAETKSWLQSNMLESDVVAYLGHAGLGYNVRALASYARFKKGRYQLYLVNGCDTFAYADDSLFRSAARANPGYAGSKYVDVISNAMPSYFAAEANVATSLVRNLVEQRKTYRQILGDFDPAQKAVVKGEEDNLWPAAFY